ncbi:MAG TPA: hypothetical protein VJ249_03195 [Candidatus Bathyarchaeia archaeon]|nr:hypothetical protein [Candidatus Bathyarchaeia archaeon]
MKPQPRLNKKWALVYATAIIALVVSTYYLTLPRDTKLRLFCAMDDAHIATDPPTWNPGYWRTPYTDYVNGYWTTPNTSTKLTVITIWEMIDGGTWVYYDNDQNIFWITVQNGPMKSTTYGPYQGILWTLTSLIHPLALTGITLSIIALIYQPIRKLWTKTHRTATAASQPNIEVVVNKHVAQTTTSKPTPPPTSKKLLWQTLQRQQQLHTATHTCRTSVLLLVLSGS